MSPSPGLHAILVGTAALAALVFSGVILARNPRSLPARMHAIYGGTAAWWLFSMAMIASAESTERAQLWARLLHLGLGMLPAVIYHLNVTTAGLAHDHRRGIRIHYACAVGVTVFCLTWPDLLAEPRRFAWGPYPQYTAWGAIPVGFLFLVFVEVLGLYRRALRLQPRGTPYHEKARAFYHGNLLATLAGVDFLAAFGLPVYPIGFVVMTVMHAATMFGSIRYRLIEITAEIAAERVLHTMPDGLLVSDNQELVRLANPAAGRLLGRDVDDLLNRPIQAVTTEVALLDAFEAVRTPEPTTREVGFESADGRSRVVTVSGTRVDDRSGWPVGGIFLLHDLTEQRQAEQETHRLEGWVRQTQRMESLGIMAGGIAHDFNNILSAILGSSEMARLKLPGDSPLQEELATISRSVEHAAELTDQLLTYAGRGTSLEEPVDLQALIGEMTGLLRSAISKKARLETRLADDLPTILGDRGQLRQVILNLVTNASEALDGATGTIVVQTDVVDARASDEPGPAEPRRKVRLRVTDTGSGMDGETRARVFDPFFTTKFAGRGLGLATVLGIVQGHGGEIRVESQPGAGARFEVRFPARTEESAAMVAAGAPGRSRPDWRGSGLVLLADDEAAVRSPVRNLLMTLGFGVEEACDGADALETFRARMNDFRLVVLDLTMPALGGREVFAEIRQLSPSMPVVFMSGYSEALGAAQLEDRATAFLHKPFDLAALARKIRETMDETEDGPVAGPP